MSILKAAPYNLTSGSSVYANVAAINAVGLSVASQDGNGA
jgi:hypothetical protein